MLQRAETLAVVTSARERARAHIGTSLSDLDALTIALAAATVDAEALLEYACEGNVRADALRARSLQPQMFPLAAACCALPAHALSAR